MTATGALGQHSSGKPAGNTMKKITNHYVIFCAALALDLSGLSGALADAVIGAGSPRSGAIAEFDSNICGKRNNWWVTGMQAAD